MLEESGKKWVLTVTVQTPTNIVVIKYWGKRDENLILPINDSISVTLDPDHLCTTTSVAASRVFTHDRMWLNGKGRRYLFLEADTRIAYGNFVLMVVISRMRKRVLRSQSRTRRSCMCSSFLITTSLLLLVCLASSAAGLVCLVFSLAKLMNVKEDHSKLSAIARRGSGSACRSLYGGFVKWIMGKEENGNDSIAVQLADEKHWDDLVIIIAVVSSRQKEIISTSGMLETVETSMLIQHRAKEVVPKRITQMEEAIQKRDFPAFARLTSADSNQFHAVCLDTLPPIFYMNDTSHRIISCVEKWNRHEGTPQVAYTFDAGPNAVLISHNRKTAALLLQRLLFYFPPQSDIDLNSCVIGDKTILKDAGVQGMKDIEALAPPPEIKESTSSQRYRGDVGYFICTKPGRGTVVLTDENQSLINPETGLPK